MVYGRGFFPHGARERGGAEIRIEKNFFWDNTHWYIPAVYACTKGLVMDFCVSAEAEAFKAFWDKWTDENGQEREYTAVDPRAPHATADIIVGVIGGADVYFKKQEQMEWHMAFHEKTMQDITIPII